MNTVVLQGWHCAIHSALVPKRAWMQGGITEERGGDTDFRRKERDRPAANSPNETFPATDECCIQKLKPFEDSVRHCKSTDVFVTTHSCTSLSIILHFAFQIVPGCRSAPSSVPPREQVTSGLFAATHAPDVGAPRRGHQRICFVIMEICDLSCYSRWHARMFGSVPGFPRCLMPLGSWRRIGNGSVPACFCGNRPPTRATWQRQRALGTKYKNKIDKHGDPTA